MVLAPVERFQMGLIAAAAATFVDENRREENLASLRNQKNA
jgi:hypothetical protein